MYFVRVVLAMMVRLGVILAFSQEIVHVANAICNGVSSGSDIGIESGILHSVLSWSDDLGGLVFLVASMLMCEREYITMMKF